MDKHAEAQAAAAEHRDSADNALPSYTPAATSASAAEQTEHTYQLEDPKGRPWIWLIVKSRAKDKKTWPLFYERDVIQGTVEVDFDKTDGAKGVTIGITGGVTAVGHWAEELVFLTNTQELAPGKSGGKLKGKQSWPFSLSLPTTEIPVAEKPKAKAELFRLPPTFTERASPAYIDYKLVVTVRRGAFKVNQTLTTSIFYTPLSRAEPPSILRQEAYQNGTVLPGPDIDPKGWKVLPPLQFTGTLFDAKQVTVDGEVAIASPLSYAIGSPIPLLLTIRSADEQALDVLCTPGAMKFHLYRERLIGSHAVKEVGGQSNNTFREVVGNAAFWLSQDDPKEAGKRKLHGELEVKKGLRPSFTFPRFSVRYGFIMYPPEAPGFVPANPLTSLFTEIVAIHTLGPVGVVPKAFAPPGYAPQIEANYNIAAGYLENGNQRFYHHDGFM